MRACLSAKNKTLRENVNILNRINNAVAAFNRTENNIGVDPNSYLRYGPRRMAPRWTTPEIGDRDFYTGYGFAVINKRANRSVVLGKNFLYTDAKEDVIAKANEDGRSIIHPYLDLIRSSIDFAERDFWYDISTYLDLEGIYYLMAVRTVRGNRVGNVQKFSLLNPYNVRQVVDAKGNLGGYVEQRGNMQRQIPKEMIIPIRLLNPFDNDKAYSLADAARDSQYTLKQANDFAREAIDGNLNAPGILSSAIELPDDQFDNFVERVKNHGRGEPLFGNGSGTINWVDMQTDLDKAALDKINSINRDTLLAISGLSKTGVGVEESGTGREVSRTQKDDFTENAVMPQIENIIDALNLDYRRYYEEEWKRHQYSISLSNPLETNKDAEQADVDIRDSQFELMQTMVDKGYSTDIASKYAKGLIDITDIGEPTEKQEPNEMIEVDETKDAPSDANGDSGIGEVDSTKDDKSKSEYKAYEAYPIPVLQYLGEDASQIDPLTENGSVIHLEEPVKMARIDHVEGISDRVVAKFSNGTSVELAHLKPGADSAAIVAKLNKYYRGQPVAIKGEAKSPNPKDHLHRENNFYEVVKNAAFDEIIEPTTRNLLESVSVAEEKLFSWYEQQISDGNLSPHPTELEEWISGLSMPFAVYFTVMFPIYARYQADMTAKTLGIEDDMPVIALTEDMKQQINDFSRKEATSHINTVNTDLQNALAKITASTSDIDEIKQQFALAFDDIQKRRAEAIANNASARIFRFSGYEADKQLLTRSDMLKTAYKQLYSMSGDPCEICTALIAETEADPIPFEDEFVHLGQTIEAGNKKMTFDYESIEAGGIHPGCRCSYRLILSDVDL